MEKGDIIYFNPKEREATPQLSDKKHPIICLEDVNSHMDCFHSAILSTDEDPKNSNVPNIEIDLKYFDKNSAFRVPGTYKHEYLVSMGIWKEIPQLPKSKDGRISTKGLNIILCELLKQVIDSKQEELYVELIQIVRKFVDFEYVKTDIKTHVKNNTFNS